ncbi:MAG TPA: 3-deoxy-7-phosphoheptulonate synthase [bacterium]|nr:3-deoxy-7-phosphoheptulonate synthase [Candidatus Omnitrophota bacterium]HOJ62365.1 3-deoxy-7-phosphoheptulonate synthase [bacterium]HOL96004.1 3-deoxy-7-phosphoheptulonate synthase [bacterium]HPP02036.1 3-deoxy-7-phosphoheptulonate synthase [bacterium]HXK93356.1 3-deoxy-7-phosphoheptulonate synthase [bacterium]
MKQMQDLHVLEFQPLISPRRMKEEIPITDTAAETVLEGRNTIKRMLRGKDKRLLAIVGPCSIHDEKAAYEYAARLAALRAELIDQMHIVMRVYFEKPRTTIGWKGLIYDPYLNGSDNMEHGTRKAREIMLKIVDMGLPAATEFLDPIVPQYLDDLVSWAAIGARTIESQTHREMSSGLSMPIGFKNNTDGNLQLAIDAMCSSRAPHSFLGVDQEGQTAIVKTSGNVWGHIILRGGRNQPNYSREDIQRTVACLEAANLPAYIMVDCSHANSGKDYRRQEVVLTDVIAQRLEGNEHLFGIMLESNLFEGNQPIPKDLSQLQYGISITDACIGWETTERILRETHAKLKTQRQAAYPVA